MEKGRTEGYERKEGLWELNVARKAGNSTACANLQRTNNGQANHSSPRASPLLSAPHTSLGPAHTSEMAAGLGAVQMLQKSLADAQKDLSVTNDALRRLTGRDPERPP